MNELIQAFSKLSSRFPEAAKSLNHYYQLVLEESQRQNLTRLLNPEDFFHGHVLDSLALLKSGFLGDKCMDLGTGMGVPGIVCAIFEPKRHWILCESEKRKAEFLVKCQTALNLNTNTIHQRAEDYLKKNKVPQIVSRAVAKVEKLNRLLRECSTWNELILMKGPGWEEEWETFSRTSAAKHFRNPEIYRYKLDNSSQIRNIVRVPRGTLHVA